jgi:hypothetical protein
MKNLEALCVRFNSLIRRNHELEGGGRTSDGRVELMYVPAAQKHWLLELGGYSTQTMSRHHRLGPFQDWMGLMKAFEHALDEEEAALDREEDRLGALEEESDSSIERAITSE